MIVSHSEVESHLLCSRRHYYAFGERIAKRNMSESLQRGIQGHVLMQSFFETYKATNSWDDSISAVAQAYTTMLTASWSAEELKRAADLQVRVMGFLSHFRSTMEAWEIVSVEQDYRIPIPDPDIEDLVYAFTPDAVVRYNNAYWVVDWKFPYNFYNRTAFALMPQIPKYVGALRDLGWANVRGGYYGFIRYRSLKDATPPQLYRLDPVTPNRYNINQTWAEYRTVAREIAHKKQHSLPAWVSRTIRVGNHLVCNSCAFKELCGAEKEGSEAKRIREELYVPSTYGYIEVAE